MVLFFVGLAVSRRLAAPAYRSYKGRLLRSHYVSDIIGGTAWEADSLQANDQYDDFWSGNSFWQQELQHNQQVARAQQARVAELQKRLAAKEAENAAKRHNLKALQQELDGKQHLLKALQQNKASQASYHTLPPLPRRKATVNQLREELAALKAQHADKQAVIDGYRYELHILDITPMGGMIRIATGDTIMDDIRDEQEKATAELEAVRQEQGENQALIAELKAEVQGILAADMAQQQLESKLQAQVNEAKQMHADLLQKLSADTASSREEAKQLHTALLRKLSASIALGTDAVIHDSSLS